MKGLKNKVAKAAFFTHRLDRRNGGFLLEIDNGKDDFCC